MRRAQNFIPHNYKTKPIQCQVQVRQACTPAPNSPTPHSFAQTNSTSPPSPEGRGWASTRLFTLSHCVNLGKKRMCPLHSLVVKPARGARRTALPLAKLTTYVEMFDRRCLRATGKPSFIIASALADTSYPHESFFYHSVKKEPLTRLSVKPQAA